MYKTINITVPDMAAILDTLEAQGQKNEYPYQKLKRYWDDWMAKEKAQQERDAQKQASRERRAAKSNFRKTFIGSNRLFEACWREALKYKRLYLEEISEELLEQIASEKVNNPKSSFFIYGK